MTTLNLPTLKGGAQISEIFGPTYQGEGVDIGRTCFFLRLQHCPVKCPGCDTHFTWDGSEKGSPLNYSQVFENLMTMRKGYEGAGLIVSGGEPLIHYKSRDFFCFLSEASRVFPWMSLETSGFISPTSITSSSEEHIRLVAILRQFTTVHLSPKITPCLHGEWTNEELCCNIPYIAQAFGGECKRLVFKFVVRDGEDLTAVDEFLDKYKYDKTGFEIQAMPYGIHRNEIIETSIKLLPLLAARGWRLSPRLHSIFWGPKRGV